MVKLNTVRWDELERRQPRLAERGRQLLITPGVVLVATIRRDGSPRLSPVEPYVMNGTLYLSMLWGSHKAADLLRDSRILIHSVVSGPAGDSGEFKVRGVARSIEDRAVQSRYAAAVGEDLGWKPEIGRFHLFDVDISTVAFVRYDTSSGDQYVAMWPEGGEFVRRATSATSVGRREPYDELLVAGDR